MYGTTYGSPVVIDGMAGMLRPDERNNTENRMVLEQLEKRVKKAADLSDRWLRDAIGHRHVQPLEMGGMCFRVVPTPRYERFRSDLARRRMALRMTSQEWAAPLAKRVGLHLRRADIVGAIVQKGCIVLMVQMGEDAPVHAVEVCPLK